MATKFKCLDCKTTFYSENDFPSVCPVCSSENLSPCNSDNVVSGILMAVMSIVCVVIGYFVTGIFLVGESPSEQKSETESPASIAATTYQAPVQVQEQAPEEKYPVIRFVSAPTLSGGKYSFQVDASGDNLEYLLYDSAQQGVISSNTNGRFSSINPSSDGMYKLVVRNSRNPQLNTGKMLSGFDAPVAEKPLAPKISKERIQQIINSGSMDQELYAVSKKCKVNVRNLSADDLPPGKITEVINNIPSPWRSISVESVSYDSYNNITSITISVVHDN